jgi:hypothetical protein
MVGLRGYCLGQTIPGFMSGKDARWFILAHDKGLVTSAELDGYGGRLGTDPSPCPGARPVPHKITTANPQASIHAGIVHLYAQADGDVGFVGWAAAWAQTGAGNPSYDWQSIGAASPEEGGFGLDWDTRMLPIPGPKGTQQVILAAVACYAAFAPGEAQTYQVVKVPNGVASPGPPAGVANQPALSSESKNAARRIACEPTHNN